MVPRGVLSQPSRPSSHTIYWDLANVHLALRAKRPNVPSGPQLCDPNKSKLCLRDTRPYEHDRRRRIPPPRGCEHHHRIRLAILARRLKSLTNLTHSSGLRFASHLARAKKPPPCQLPKPGWEERLQILKLAISAPIRELRRFTRNTRYNRSTDFIRLRSSRTGSRARLQIDLFIPFHPTHYR